MTIVIYGKPDCTKCTFTRAILDKMITLGQLPGGYEYIDITKDPDAAQDVQDMGYRVLPVVVASRNGQSESWCDLRVDKLDGLREE